ncbi:paraquat-inducible protein A [Reichenbachiella versicolor]|uniref:paraquat-inducible protein A n=1 Tax=Reichenbachiella versicolor TaxID=1821036 RepID=UPI000D6E2DCB|nr:paraquat-inducible protein A [Reichenbachiella versicolor]
MQKRNIVALVFTVVSLILLYPGLTEPILKITIAADLPIVGRMTFHEQTQSILQSIRVLHKNNNTLVAALILIFSVVVPVIKGVIVLATILLKEYKLKNRLYRFVFLIGKWSMADVFVVGIFIAYLSTTSNSAIDAKLLVGFNFFVAYCILSLLGIQLTSVNEKTD